MNNLCSTQNEMSLYQSRQPHWENNASIRTRPRRILNDDQDIGYFFPISRQPLCVHPEITKLGEAAIRYILVQSLYKYMNDIANIETDVINYVTHKISKDRLKFTFSEEIRKDALSIIIDETYHAYVAIDFMGQVSKKTQIKPLPLPKENGLSLAIQTIKEKIPLEIHEAFEVVAVCMAEHVLTNDLISAIKSKEVTKIFYHVMQDHVIDEGRHSAIFFDILKIYWKSLSEEEKNCIAETIPEFIGIYLNAKYQIEFEKTILRNLEIEDQKAEQILAETHPPIDFSQGRETNPVIVQIISLLKRSEMLAHPRVYGELKRASLVG